MTDCIFCNQIHDEVVLYQTKHFKLVFDIHPIQTGHLLLISKRHYASITQLSADELHDLIETEAYLISMLEETSGYGTVKCQKRSGRPFQVERLEIRERREIEIVIFDDLTIFVPLSFF